VHNCNRFTAKDGIVNKKLLLGKTELAISADDVKAKAGDLIITGKNVSLGLPFMPKKFYRHGWQSWSLATWVDTSRPVTPVNPPRIRPQADDLVNIASPRWCGSWLGAVETDNGDILLLGALGLDAHVELDKSTLRGWYESGPGDWLVALAPEEHAFGKYASLLGELFGGGRGHPARRVWCSWYSLYSEINENSLHRILDDLGSVPFDVFQIDDGWQESIGDWEPNHKFPSGMTAMAEKIRATGRTAGLWLAPLLVVPSSRTYHDHFDWLLRDAKGRPVSAGHNWGESLFTLEIGREDVLEWLASLMKKVRSWGYDYIKLDFLYAGALSGERFKAMPRETAYRQALSVMREALGEAYLLTCGAPIVASLGLCDAMRIGPDVGGIWNNPIESTWMNNYGGIGTQNAIRTSLHRLWLKPLVHTDPDVVYFRSKNNLMNVEQMALLRDLAWIAGYRASSDFRSCLSEVECEALVNFLETSPRIERTGRYTFLCNGREVDFSPVVPLPDPANVLMKSAAGVLAKLANSPIVLRAYNHFIKRNLGTIE